jgi:hypothetical protein
MEGAIARPQTAGMQSGPPLARVVRSYEAVVKLSPLGCPADGNEMNNEKWVRSLLRRAGIVEPAPGGTGALASEPTLVLRGGYQSTLKIFNCAGQQIGTAERTRGRYSRDGYQYRYELLGLEPSFTLTDISKGRFVSLPQELTIARGDGSHVASAHRGTTVVDRGARESRRPPWESFVFERDAETIATLLKMPRKELRQSRPRPSTSNPVILLQQIYDRFVSDRLFYVLDPSDRQVARITYLPGPNGYVVEQEPTAPEPLPTITVAACIIVNNAFASAGDGGGGA